MDLQYQKANGSEKTGPVMGLGGGGISFRERYTTHFSFLVVE